MAEQHITLGITNPKSPGNMGSILRAAGCFGVDKVIYTGSRFDTAMRFATDTRQIASNIPMQNCGSFEAAIPQGATVVTVELIEGATPLPMFAHPDNAFYIFGPEDGSVNQQGLSYSDEVVYIPTTGCLNLAATVNRLLYDRMSKASRLHWGDELIKQSRDTNNRAVWRG